MVLVVAVGGQTAERFTLDATRSSLTIHTSRAGLLKFAGHDHDIRALAMKGEIIADPANLSASSVSITLEAARLAVQPDGEPPADVPNIQERMLGPELLDVARFPEIAFRSAVVVGRPAAKGAFDLDIDGALSLHGVTRRIHLRLEVALGADLLIASGESTLRQTDFGLTPVSVAGGTVKVKDEVTVRYSIVARRAPDAP
jgi:polyisoprenoid-binding protein YceI